MKTIRFLAEQRPRRKWWYAMQERNSTRTPVDKKLVGMEIRVSRVIIRCGYLWEHMDADYAALEPMVDEIMADKFRQAMFPYLSLVPGKVIDALVKNADEAFGKGIFKQATYTARGKWLEKQYEGVGCALYKHWRTFWYVNVKDIDPDESRWLQVVGIKRHVVGKQYPASYDSWEGMDLPGGIEDACHQAVYQTEGLIGRNYDDYYDGWSEVHPLDVLETRCFDPDRDEPYFR